MNKALYTAGPWSASWSLVGCWLVKLHSSPTAPHDFTLKQGREGDARLAAAAPDLWEALETLEDAVSALLGTVGCIRARNPEDDDTHIHEKRQMDDLLRERDAARALIERVNVERQPASMDCEDCGGSGVQGEEMWQGEFQPPERERCSNCDGSGKWLFVKGEPA